MRLTPEYVWTEALESLVDKRVVKYLKEHNTEYQNCLNQIQTLCEKFPVLIDWINGKSRTTLSEKEHRAYEEYCEFTSNREMLERAYCYFLGQSDMFAHQQFLKNLTEIEMAETESRNEEILQCLKQNRLEQAEKEFRFERKYQKERDEVFRYEQELRSMGLSEETIAVIDHYRSALNAEWLRYGELAYQYGMEDILAMIKG